MVRGGGGGGSTERFRQIRRRGDKTEWGRGREREGESVCEARRGQGVGRGVHRD